MSALDSEGLPGGISALRSTEAPTQAPRGAVASSGVAKARLKLFIVVSFANFAGAQIAALRLARGLRDRGHDPRVIFLYQQASVDSPDHPYEVLVPKVKPSPPDYLRMAGKLASLVRAEKPDLVLTFMPLANVIGQATARATGVRQRVVSHRMPVGAATPLMRRLDGIWAKLGVYTQVVAVSDSVRDSCAHYPAKLLGHTSVVHNGLRNWQASNLSQAEARAKFGIPEGKFALVAVGRFAGQKNYPFMLKVMSRLDKALLLVAGEGPLRPEIEEGIRTLGIGDRVRLLGPVARPDIPHLLAAADVFIQTSTYEGQSNSILEAMQAGTPILAHDIPEQRETIADADGAAAGALLPLEDLDAWVAAAERFRSDPSAVAAAKTVGARRSQLFTYDAMVAGFEKALTEG
jgi:glycosyltransferase involved in cell wall biosynthesis